ncbi:DUF305 domain-containing protein [Streptomyces sp. NPDC018693]|uniref:DUF305 domain-containing protein n=1 Tax=unclassified Streptomyces TaxID=2593676 RepID=UPI0037AB69D4
MTRNTRARALTRRAAAVAVTVTAAFALAACGGEGDGGSAAGDNASASATADAHNAQDVTFAQGMIPHHRQALEMAALAADRASSAQVKDLAGRIEKAQDPEIQTMTGWLTAWGEDAPAAGGHSGHSGGMAGMMNAEDMAKLEKTSGGDFDSMFLTMMIEHHEGAVEMAEAEQAKGAYGPAMAMAGDIVAAQTAEIEEMKKLLAQK